MSIEQLDPQTLTNRFRESFMFSQYFTDCMESDKTLRGNCWNHDVLISNCNLLIEKFLKTQTSSIDKYFRTFVVCICVT